MIYSCEGEKEVTHHKRSLDVKIDAFLQDFDNVGAAFLLLQREIVGKKEQTLFNIVRSHMSNMIIDTAKLAEMIKGAEDEQ